MVLSESRILSLLAAYFYYLKILMSQLLPGWVIYEQQGAPITLPEELSLYRAITKNIPSAAVFVVGQDFRYLLAGGNGLKNAGMMPSDFEGKFLAEVVPAEMLGQAIADYIIILSGAPFVREHYVGQRYYRTRGRLIKGTDGACDVALAVSYDITEEISLEEEG